jgi:hypothetical protein
MKLMFHLENMKMNWYIIYPILKPKNHMSIIYVFVIKPLIQKIETTYDIIPNIWLMKVNNFWFVV